MGVPLRLRPRARDYLAALAGGTSEQLGGSPAVVQRDRRPAAGMRACGQRLFLVLLAGAG